MTEAPQPYGEAPCTDFEVRFRRLFEAAGCRTHSELAAALAVKQSAISDAKRRKAIPAGWLLALLKSRGVNPEWIMHGTSPRFLFYPGFAKGVCPAAQTRQPENLTTEELLGELLRRVVGQLE